METYISGFMIVREVERQGYPFIEAGRSALSVCDELLISDGYSTDRTWEGLLGLHAAFPDRVHLFQDRWPDHRNRGEILAAMTNRVRRRCRGTYCLSVQANEVIEPSAAQQIVTLPSRYPDIEMFALGFLVQLGLRLVWSTDWRRRLFKNIADILAVGDAFDVGNVLPRVSRTLRAPLVDPVRHYRATCPVDYVTKLRSAVPHDAVWAQELVLAEHALLGKGSVSVDAFWEQVRAAVESRGVISAPLTPTHQVPVLLQHLVGKWRYNLDDSLAALASCATTG